MSAATAERIQYLEERVDVADCWLWRLALRKGYGTAKENGVSTPAHRWVYELLVGPIPDGLELDHLCRVRNCVNPDHLEPVTRKVNHNRGAGRFNRRGMTHCKRGHSLSDAYVGSWPSRNCRKCSRQRQADYLRRKAAA